MKKINLEINTGYEIINKKQTVKMRKALNLLLSGEQAKYTSATNNYDGSATLSYSTIRCPFCGSESPVKQITAKSIDRDKIIQWSAYQLNLLEPENPELIIRKNPFFKDIFNCPSCKKESKKDDKHYNITICKNKGKITASCVINDIEEFLSICWQKEIELKSPFMYYETVVFNLHNGHSYVQITDTTGDALCTRDITENPDFITNGILYDLILKSQKLRKKLKNIFGVKFNSQSITLEKLITAARFVGYDRRFYNAIPFEVGTYRLFPGFETIAKKLHRAKDVPRLYEHLNLPKSKATRRIIFSNPWMMFYYNEINMLYRIIYNIDYFNKLLLFDNIYYILSQINGYPIIGDFIKEAFKYENSSVVMKQLEENFNSMSRYAIRYMSMNDFIKRRERNQNNWLSSYGKSGYYKTDSEILPSFVRVLPPVEIPDCRIGRYNFEWLSNTSDYMTAGEMMHNCLSQIQMPVVVIKSNRDYVAAMSLNLRENSAEISESYLCRNHPIDANPDVCLAIKKWCVRYNVRWDESKRYR